MMILKRIKKIVHTPPMSIADLPEGQIAYWMSREQRATDNHALIYAERLAIQYQRPLVIFFCLSAPSLFSPAPLRAYQFMIEGLLEVKETFNNANRSFHLLLGNPIQEVEEYISRLKVAYLVSDFNPLKPVRNWKKELVPKIQIPWDEVDAHNIIPVWSASPKQEWAAYSLRPKIHKLLPDYTDSYADLKLSDKERAREPLFNLKTAKLPKESHYYLSKLEENFNLKSILAYLKPNASVPPVSPTLIPSGSKQALLVLKNFIQNRLDNYAQNKNLPHRKGLSGLSPYLHFGQISPLTIYHQVMKKRNNQNTPSILSFIEELVVRRELADNFCYYNSNYDSFEGAPAWAKETLRKEQSTHRPYIYSLEELELAITHDELWNSAQLEMVYTGKMHGYLRMYWAKKILEWSPNPEEAVKRAIYLNDLYELDGRDPSGYVGILWAIGGLHDRPWPSHPLFGAVRMMSFKSTVKKFDWNLYNQLVLDHLEK